MKKPKKPGIYKLTNLLNGRFYIGSSKNLHKRKGEHFSSLKIGKHRNRLIQEDFDRDGVESFSFEIVLYCDSTNLIFYEQKFLDKYFDRGCTCYNLYSKANSQNCKESKPWCSEEAMKRVAEAKKARRQQRKRKNRVPIPVPSVKSFRIQGTFGDEAHLWPITKVIDEC